MVGVYPVGVCSIYNVVCPSVQNDIAKRILTSCNMYFPSPVLVASHNRRHFSFSNEISRVKPIRIADRLKTIFTTITDLAEMEEEEWLEKDDEQTLHICG